MLTERENRYCVEISHRVARMRSFLSTNNLKEPPDPTGLFEFLLSLAFGLYSDGAEDISIGLF